MIVLPPLNDVPATAEYYHTVDIFLPSPGLNTIPGACCFGLCETKLPVFANLDSPDDSDENDLSSVIIEVSSTSTVELTLKDLKTGNDILITDSTYGIYYPKGSFTTRPNVFGFILLWSRVADNLGFGEYQLELVVKGSSDNITYQESSPCYVLHPYSCQNANGTIRFSSLQKGYIDDGFDFRNLTAGFTINWPQQIRLYGYVDRNPITVTDYITDTENQDRSVQVRNYHEWSCTMRNVNGMSYDFLIDEFLLSHPITMNSDNVYDSRVFRNVQLSFDNVEKEQKQGPMQKEEFFKINFNDYKKGKIKRY